MYLGDDQATRTEAAQDLRKGTRLARFSHWDICRMVCYQGTRGNSYFKDDNSSKYIPGL